MTAGPGSILAVMAHPDDVGLWAGGTFALHAVHARVTVAIPAQDEARNAEAAIAAKVLGAQIQLVERLDGRAVQGLIAWYRPEVLITHPRDDVHPGHRQAAAAVLQALPGAFRATERPQRLYTCDTFHSLTLGGPVRASMIVDVSATFELKVRALAEQVSPSSDPHFGWPMAGDLSRLWGGRIGTNHAEAFTALPILGRLPAFPHL